MLGLSVVPALLQFLGFLFLPESPRWLIQKGLTQKARRVLSQIRGNQNIDEEYDTIKSSIEEEEKDCGGGGKIVLQALSHASSSKKHKYSLSSLVSLNYGKYSSAQENTMWILANLRSFHIYSDLQHQCTWKSFVLNGSWWIEMKWALETATNVTKLRWPIGMHNKSINLKLLWFI